jgi:hypothetical protein
MPNVDDALTRIVNNSREYTATIAAGERNFTAPVFCSGNSFLAMTIDSTFTPATLTFYGSLSGEEGTFYELCERLSDGTVQTIEILENSITDIFISLTAPAVGAQIPLPPAIFAGVQFLQIRCSIVQATTQTVKLIMAPVLSGK